MEPGSLGYDSEYHRSFIRDFRILLLFLATIEEGERGEYELGLLGLGFCNAIMWILVCGAC